MQGDEHAQRGAVGVRGDKVLGLVVRVVVGAGPHRGMARGSVNVELPTVERLDGGDTAL